YQTRSRFGLERAKSGRIVARKRCDRSRQRFVLDQRSLFQALATGIPNRVTLSIRILRNADCVIVRAQGARSRRDGGLRDYRTTENRESLKRKSVSLCASTLDYKTAVKTAGSES